MTINQVDSLACTLPAHGEGSPPPRRRILLLTLECTFAPFSGNGVLARSLAASLAARSDCLVRVVAARPHPSFQRGRSRDVDMDVGSSSVDGGGECADVGAASLEIWPVDLPPNVEWRRLDRSGPWREYAAGCGGDDNAILRRAEAFEPTDVVAVDWHGMLAWESMQRGTSRETPRPNVVYYNFRVYSSSCWEHAAPSLPASDDDAFYREKEQRACRLADGIVCLAEHDRGMLQRLIKEDEEQTKEPIEETRKQISVLPPPLRGDIWELAQRTRTTKDGHGPLLDRCLPREARQAIERSEQMGTTCDKRRMFITCMARFSPEKAPHNFVSLLRRLGGAAFLREHGLVPLMCGARSVEDYAQIVLDDFQSMCSSEEEDGGGWPCVVIDHHLGPRELAALFSRTAINVHPCLYDAYGMTLVECAAFGVPSIVNSGGKIGAASLLGEGKGCIAVDLERILAEKDDVDSLRETLAQVSRSASEMEPLDDAMDVRGISEEAMSRALGWDEKACCQGLVEILTHLRITKEEEHDMAAPLWTDVPN